MSAAEAFAVTLDAALAGGDDRSALLYVLRMRGNDLGIEVYRQVEREVVATLSPADQRRIAEMTLAMLEGGEFVPGLQTARGRLLVKRIASSLGDEALRDRADAHSDRERGISPSAAYVVRITAGRVGFPEGIWSRVDHRPIAEEIVAGLARDGVSAVIEGGS